MILNKEEVDLDSSSVSVAVYRQDQTPSSAKEIQRFKTDAEQLLIVDQNSFDQSHRTVFVDMSEI